MCTDDLEELIKDYLKFCKKYSGEQEEVEPTQQIDLEKKLKLDYLEKFFDSKVRNCIDTEANHAYFIQNK